MTSNILMNSMKEKDNTEPCEVCDGSGKVCKNSDFEGSLPCDFPHCSENCNEGHTCFLCKGSGRVAPILNKFKEFTTYVMWDESYANEETGLHAWGDEPHDKTLLEKFCELGVWERLCKLELNLINKSDFTTYRECPMCKSLGGICGEVEGDFLPCGHDYHPCEGYSNTGCTVREICDLCEGKLYVPEEVAEFYDIIQKIDSDAKTINVLSQSSYSIYDLYDMLMELKKELN